MSDGERVVDIAAARKARVPPDPIAQRAIELDRTLAAIERETGRHFDTHERIVVAREIDAFVDRVPRDDCDCDRW